MSTNVIITFTVKEDCIKEFGAILSTVKETLPDVEGCNSVNVYADSKNKCVYTLVENWDSEELHKSHISRVVESGDWENIAKHLQKDPESSYFIKM